MSSRLFIGALKFDRPRPGGKMTKGTGWRLVATRGQKRYFVGTLLYTHNFNKARVAVFSVPKLTRPLRCGDELKIA